MAIKNHVYLDEGRRNYKLDYSGIINEFITTGILDKGMLGNDKRPKYKEIFDYLNKNRDKFIEKEIILNIELDNEILNDGYLENRFQEKYSINELGMENIKDIEGVMKVLKSFYILTQNIEIAINRALSSRPVGINRNIVEIKFDDKNLQNYYLIYKGVIERRNGSEIDIFKSKNNHFDYTELSRQLSEIIKNKTIKVQVNTKFFISSFLEKIDVSSEFKSEEEKINLQFIDKFKDTRKEKLLLAEKYLKYGTYSILILLSINIILYLYNLGNALSFDGFLQRFLGSGIYILFIEIIVITIGTYYFKLYNFYSKMVELYDSHIGLIESDLHYKNDEQLINGGNDALFELRKENTQKIHSLPDKALDLLSLKGDMKTSSDFSIKIIEKLIDKIK